MFSCGLLCFCLIGSAQVLRLGDGGSRRRWRGTETTLLIEPSVVIKMAQRDLDAGVRRGAYSRTTFNCSFSPAPDLGADTPPAKWISPADWHAKPHSS